MRDLIATISPYVYNVIAVFTIILWIMFTMGNLLFGSALGSIPLLLALILRKLDLIEKGR